MFASVERGVYCKLWSVKCELRRVEYGDVWTVRELAVWNVECGV